MRLSRDYTGHEWFELFLASLALGNWLHIKQPYGKALSEELKALSTTARAWADPPVSVKSPKTSDLANSYDHVFIRAGSLRPRTRKPLRIPDPQETVVVLILGYLKIR